MLKSFNFPSAYEATNMEFVGASVSLINGLKINYDDNDYLVGNLAMSEGSSPHKSINVSPDEHEYGLFAQAALLFADAGEDDRICLTTGFPFSTYQLYKDSASEKLTGKHTVTFDASLLGGSGYGKKEITVSQVNVIPELLGCISAVRHGEPGERGNFFMVSLGFGTCEGGVSTAAGIVNRSVFSTHGLQHALNLFVRELEKKFYLGLKTEQQLDVVFQNGVFTWNRVKHNVSDLRAKALRMYYKEVLSPNFKRAFTDDDFNKCTKMYLAGGGALLPELVECFKEEFGDVIGVNVYPEPEKCASHGYCLYSVGHDKTSAQEDFSDMTAEDFMKSGKKIYAGLDLGNANTCVTIHMENEQ